MRNLSRALLVGMALVVGSSLVPMLGCGGRSERIATPQLLQRLGTRKYSNHSAADLRTAAVTGLRLQGYTIVTEQPIIRTAPKLVAVTSTAYGSGYSAQAQSYGESMAWDVDVQDEGGVGVITLKHRASVNGMAMEQVWESWANTNYKQMFDIIESSLPKPGAAAFVPTAQPAASAPIGQ